MFRLFIQGHWYSLYLIKGYRTFGKILGLGYYNYFTCRNICNIGNFDESVLGPGILVPLLS